MYMYRGGEGQSTAQDLSASWSQIAPFVAAVEGRLGKWLADTYNLGLTEYRALLLLSGAPDKELRVNDLAQRIGLTQSSVTRLLGRLEAKSLTYRDPCPDDGRGVFAVIMEQGLDLLREARPPYEEKVAELINEVADRGTGVDRRQVSSALAAVSELLTK